MVARKHQHLRYSMMVIAIVMMFFSGCGTTPLPHPKRIILDTDFGGDADDLAALAMLHHFHSNGDIDLLGVVSWSTERYAISAIDAVNRYYGHPDIPIALRKSSIHDTEWNYSRVIAEQFDHEVTPETAKDAVALYRELLWNSPDASVVIVVIGPLKNIEHLLESPSDAVVPMTGKELIRTKVSEMVVMGGGYPSIEWEWNFNGNMPGTTASVFSQLDVPIVVSGYEVGLAIQTGSMYNSLDANTPLYVGYRYFSEHAPWVKDRFEGQILDNASYDQTAVLYAAIGGVGHYWDSVGGERCVPDSVGGNVWVPDSLSNHRYLVLRMPPEQIARDIDRFTIGNH